MNKSSTQNNSNEIPEFFLTFGMHNCDKSKGGAFDACPLDNKQINNGYIKAEGNKPYKGEETDERKFKCFTLHPIIDRKDITPYTYGYIGYDLNADSMKVYAGGWYDLTSDCRGNNLIKDINDLDINGKQGHLYLDKKGKVHLTMLEKVKNRAKRLKTFANDDKQSIFDKNTTLDSSFTANDYRITISDDKNTFTINQKEIPKENRPPDVENFYEKYGVSNLECFMLIYDKKNDKFELRQNELNGVARGANKGIKVDRIFVKKSVLDINSDYWLKIYKDIKKREKKYQKYMQDIIEVLIKNFPNGDIRIIDGQNFKIIKTEDFIQTYIQNEKEKNFYLSELEKKRKSIQQNKEEQITTSKYLEDISSHTLHNKEIISMAQPEQAVDNQQHIYTTGQNTASNNGNFLSTVNNQTTQMSKTIINPANNPDTNENNINNNDSDWHLCSCWKQCWDRCC